MDYMRRLIAYSCAYFSTAEGDYWAENGSRQKEAVTGCGRYVADVCRTGDGTGTGAGDGTGNGIRDGTGTGARTGDGIGAETGTGGGYGL